MSRTAFLAMLATLLPLCTTAASVPREEYEVESHDFRGTWRVVSLILNGRNDPTSKVERFIFSADNRCGMVRQGEKKPITDRYFSIHTNQTPHGFDFLYGFPGSEPSARGIYRLEGKRLTLCWTRGGSRPKAFRSEGPHTFLVELARVK